MTDPNLRRIHYAVAALALGLLLWGFWGQLHLARLPELQPAPEFPVRFGGVHASTPAQIALLAQGYRPGAHVELEDASGARRTVVLPRAHSNAYLALGLTSALFFWAVATFVFAPRSHLMAGRDFFWAVLLYGLVVILGGVYFPTEPRWESLARSALHLAALFALPVWFVRLALRFPRPHPRLSRTRALVPLLWVLAGVVFLWQGLNYLAYFNDPGPTNGEALVRPRSLADALLVAQVVLGFWILGTNGRALDSTREREQMKWLFWGFSVGVTPYVFLRTVPEMFGFGAPFGPAVDRVLEMAIPVSFVFAVVRYRFLDIDIIIRRSIIYAVLSAVLVGAYAIAVLLLGQFLEGRPVHRLWILFLGLGLVAGLAFHPLRQQVGRWVDRVFFKIRYDPADAATQLRRDLSAVPSAKALAVQIARTLERSLGPRVVSVVVADSHEPAVSGNIAPRNARHALERFRELDLPSDRTLAAPGSSGTSQAEVDSWDSAFAQEDVVMVRAILIDGRVEGLLMLGEREVQRRYLATDLGFLDDLADLAADALGRIRLSQAFVEESLVSLRLDELNRMKDEFLARVAHDLRTPLASISWSTENLLDGVAGGITEAQESYLRSMRTSAAHLNGMVRNLLEATRLEEGRRVEPQPVILPEVLERAIAILEPIAADRRQTIQLDLPPDLPPVLGSPDRLLEVVVNLLDNALKYSPPESAVRIGAEAISGGHLDLTVRDRGPGLPPGDPEQLFARYHQADPSPHSGRQGFGLGLHIVQGLLQHMDATLHAANHPEGGAVFRCRLRTPDPELPA